MVSTCEMLACWECLHLPTFFTFPFFYGIGYFLHLAWYYEKGLPILADPESHVTQAKSTRALSGNILDLKKGEPFLVWGCELYGYRKAKKIKTCTEKQKGRHGEKPSGGIPVPVVSYVSAVVRLWRPMPSPSCLHLGKLCACHLQWVRLQLIKLL